MEHTIFLLPDNKEIKAESGARLLDVLASNGYFISAPCGGNGTCGKCKVKLLQGEVDGTVKDEKGYVLSCKAKIKEDISVFISVENSVINQPTFRQKTDKIGMILDIGTTTLVACIVDLTTGEKRQSVSCLNPQGSYGADVLTRMQACNAGKLPLLQKLILDKTNDFIKALSLKSEVDELFVVANPTMAHLFCGENPTSIGVYPFTPVFVKKREMDGACMGLLAKKVVVLPSASGYIGGDVLSGVLSCGMHQNKKTQLLIDVGTNGEIVLSRDGQLYATSTSAGPALEGACIECGIGGVAGAIDSVWLEKGEIRFSTIDGQAVTGVCGSGLIDAVALLLQEKLIDENGTFNEDMETPISNRLIGDKFYLTDTVYLSQQDIRQFQLAKSAIRAGIDTLLSECEVGEREISTLYVAGGLGYFMNVKNAVKVGLFSGNLENRIKTVGNSALDGARLCLLDKTKEKELERIAEEVKIVELAFSKTFESLYVKNMSFEE